MSFFFSVYLLLPLLLFVVVYFMTRPSVAMALLLLFVGPLVGVLAMVAVGELTKPRPHPLIIPVAALFFYPYALVFYGLWVTDAGILAWLGLRGSILIQRLSFGVRMLVCALLGLFAGVIFRLLSMFVFSFDSNWRLANNFTDAISHPVEVTSVLIQGMVGGIVCGLIVGLYIHGPSGLELRSTSTQN